MRRILSVVAVLVVLSGGVLYWHSQGSVPQTQISAHQTSIVLGDATIVADIADTEASREQGLSGRSSLDDAHGMLFVFQQDGQPAFWMKDMRMSIDMIWLSSDKKVVHIVPNAMPESYPTSFRPETPSRYVLEVPAGWAARHSVELGSSAAF